MNDRLAQLKLDAYRRYTGNPTSPKVANWNKAFFELYADSPLAERQARTVAYSLENEPVYIHPLERIAGQIYQIAEGTGAPDLSGVPEDPRWNDYAVTPVGSRLVAEQLPENSAYARFFCDGASPGHIGWDYGLMLGMGARGLVNKCRELSCCTEDEKAGEFYQGVEIVLNGLINWVQRHVAALREAAASETDATRKAELLEMAAVCERVPEYPATSFREAVQAFHFQHLAVMHENPFGGNGPGRLDYYLWPYLRPDLESGRITREEASELICELFIKLHERIGPADGWVEALPIGGRNPDGSSAINMLSYIILEVITDLKQTHPSVYVRLHDEAPEDFVDLTVKYITSGENRAQVYGDDETIAAVHADGVAIEDARNWTAGGCMEVSPQGCQCDLLFSFVHNVSRTLELILNGGCLLQTGERAIAQTKTLADYQNFEELYTDFERELQRELRIMLKRLDLYLGCYAKYRPSFLLSSMVHDCLEKGRSMNDGGARYMDYGGSGVGIPNVGDSLYALKRAVFEERKYTGQEILDALRADFVGHEQMRNYLWSLPKFGTDDAEVDTLVDRVLLSFTNILRSHRNPHGGHAKAIILGFVWVVSFGLETGATPDGRKSGKPLAHGLSPQGGATTKGVASAINSATRLSLKNVGGGAGMMWDIESDLATDACVKPILQTFIDKGGQIFQGNTIDLDTLLRAQECPEDYPHLMVRVGGWSARFVTLSKETQQEIIARNKFGR
ncbi:MAG: hypothetical protein HY318_07375 [Armatimonadetes bacterium]|nr:hypothetical protein [Armatimonadota bacterium]